MFFNKKGTELSMNVIIIAAISVLVLVILSVLVLKAVNKTNDGTGCESLGGQCYSFPQNGYTIPNPAFDSTCEEVIPGTKCFVKLGTKT